MSNTDVEVSMGPLSGPPSLRHHLIDFANMLKAFIGSNYLTIAFAFKQSGLHLGWIGLLVVASLTAHCCQLLVKCKYHAIQQTMDKISADGDSSDSEACNGEWNHSSNSVNNYNSSSDNNSSCSSSGDEKSDNQRATRKKLVRNIMYGDIGRMCMGKTGLTLVNVSIMITQFGFCIGYYIFIGNTIQSMFPLYNCSSPVQNPVHPNFSGGLSDARQCLEVKHLNSLNAAHHLEMEDMTETLPGVLHSKRMMVLLDKGASPAFTPLDKDTSPALTPLDKDTSPAWTPLTTQASVDSFMAFLTSGNVTTVYDSPQVLPSAKPKVDDDSKKAVPGLPDSQRASDSLLALSSNSTADVGGTAIPTPKRTLKANLTTTSAAASTAKPDATRPVFVSSTSKPSVMSTTEDSVFPFLANTTSMPWSNMTDWTLMRGDHVPDLRLLVVTPALFFVAMALIRSLRQMGFISAIANGSIFVGCFSVLVFLILGFKLSSSFKWFNLHDMPIYFGMVTGAYEGIGTILPIEASMEGNRHNFKKFLYGAIGALTLVLGSFGALGYLRFGLDVEQMINANIPSGSWLSIAVNVCLCIGVLLTFPLMMYPVVELAELYLFGKGRLCGPKAGEDDHQSLLPTEEENNVYLPIAEKVSDRVPTWKRNLLRVILVLTAGGLAVLLRNYFAYISAFVGALGSTMLAYILPCLFHLKLCWHDLSFGVKFKDIVIIFVGIVTMVMGIYAVLHEIIGSAGS